MNATNSFSKWLASEANNLTFKFGILSSARVPGGINCSAMGLEETLYLYRWRSDWTCGTTSYSSNDWRTTKVSLNALKSLICSAVEAGDRDAVRKACSAVLKWGGDRSGGKVGAKPFLWQLNDELSAYLTRIREVLSLDNGGFDRIGEVKCMNAMMTKIHALLADDGLPIYDSRVAGAAGALVELYRQNTGQNWSYIPDELNFPSTDKKRTARQLTPNAMLPDHLYYNQAGTTTKWAKAKIRLGRVMRDTLAANPKLFESELPGDRMHALEATFFMIGYDPGCLKPSLKHA